MPDLVKASPSELKDGSGWGVRIEGDHDCAPGQTVRVVTRGGKEWESVLGDKVSEGQYDGERIQYWRTGKAGGGGSKMVVPKVEDIPARLIETASMMMLMAAELLKKDQPKPKAAPKPAPAPAPTPEPEPEPEAASGVADDYDEDSVPF